MFLLSLHFGWLFASLFGLYQEDDLQIIEWVSYGLLNFCGY